MRAEHAHRPKQKRLALERARSALLDEVCTGLGEEQCNTLSADVRVWLKADWLPRYCVAASLPATPTAQAVNAWEPPTLPARTLRGGR